MTGFKFERVEFYCPFRVIESLGKQPVDCGPVRSLTGMFVSTAAIMAYTVWLARALIGTRSLMPLSISVRQNVNRLQTLSGLETLRVVSAFSGLAR